MTDKAIFRATEPISPGCKHTLCILCRYEERGNQVVLSGTLNEVLNGNGYSASLHQAL